MSEQHDLKLISFALCPYVQRARIVLLDKGIEHEIEYIDLDTPPEWFYDVSPLEKVPVLLVDGNPLFESMPICEYLNDITPGSMYPEDAFLRAQHRAWIEFGNEVLSSLYSFFTTGDEKTFKQTRGQIIERLDTLEEILEDGPYFAGDKFGMVDAVYAPIFRYIHALQRYDDFGFFDDVPQVERWSKACLERQSVKDAVLNTFARDYEDYLEEKASIVAQRIS